MDSKFLIFLLGKNNIFSFDEALEYFSEKDEHVYGAILRRDDFDAEKFVDKITSDDVILLMFLHSNLFTKRVNEMPVELIIKLMTKTTHWVGYTSIIRRSSELTAKNYVDVINSLVSDINSTDSNSISLLKGIVDGIKEPSVVYDIIKSCPSKFAKNYLCQNSYFLERYMKDSAFQTKLDIAILADSDFLWGYLFNDLKFSEGFHFLPHTRLIEIAKNSEEKIVEDMMFKVLGIFSYNLLFYAIDTNRISAWEKIFSSKMIKDEDAVVRGLRPEMVKIGIDRILLERKDIVDYLNSISLPEVIKIMKTTESSLVVKFLIERKNLNFNAESLLEVMIAHSQSKEVWKSGLLRLEIISYFKTFRPQELIAYANKHDCPHLFDYVVSVLPLRLAVAVATEKNNPRLVKIVFDRLDETSNPKYYISLAKILKKDEVWRKVISVESVREYIDK